MSEQEANLEYTQPEPQMEGNTVEEQSISAESTAQYQQENLASEPVFSSAQLLLGCAKDEYTKERERTQFLDNKASFFMSAIILVATIFVPFIPFDKVYESITTGSELQKAITYITGTLVFVSFVILVIAFKKLYAAYKIQEYERFNIENLADIGILKTEKNAMEKALCENYKNTIEKNIRKNDSKAEKVSSGIGKCAIGFLLLAISAILLKIFIG